MKQKRWQKNGVESSRHNTVEEASTSHNGRWFLHLLALSLAILFGALIESVSESKTTTTEHIITTHRVIIEKKPPHISCHQAGYDDGWLVICDNGVVKVVK